MSVRPSSGALIGLLLAMTSALGGCVDNDASLSIDRFLPPDPASLATGSCKFDPTVATNITRGTYDVSIAVLTGSGYFANFEVKNNLLENATQPIETQYYYVNSFDVELEVKGPIQTAIPASARNFNYQSGTIRLAPAGKAAASSVAIKPEWVPALAALAGVDMQGSIIMHVRPVSTRGENQVVGAFATFPIDVCFGCLSGGGLTSSGSFPPCPSLRASPSPGNACNVAQDLPIDCCNPTDPKSPNPPATYSPKAAVCGADAKPKA